MITMPIEPPVTEYLHAKAARLGIPISGTFELTPCCNLSCKMCYVRMTKQEQESIAPLRTAEEWIALGQKAKEAGMLYLLLTGGEPFLRPDFREILTGLSQMGLVLSINSNGTMIDETVVEWLKEIPVFRINITLYGASNETYKRLCGNPYGFDQTVKAIRLLKQAGISVKINCSVTPYNKDDLEAIFAFAEEEELVVQATAYMFPPLRRDAEMVGINDRFLPEDAAYQQACINCLMYGKDSFLERMEKNAPVSLSSELGAGIELPPEGDGIRCRAGKCSFWVTWRGNLLPCGMLPDTNTKNIFEVDFAEAWKEICETADAIRLPAKCSVCEIKNQCRACAAMVYTESGSYEKVPEYRCRMAKSIYGAYRKLEQEILDERKGND